jgi:hypothetical protein
MIMVYPDDKMIETADLILITFLYLIFAFQTFTPLIVFVKAVKEKLSKLLHKGKVLPEEIIEKQVEIEVTSPSKLVDLKAEDISEFDIANPTNSI